MLVVPWPININIIINIINIIINNTGDRSVDLSLPFFAPSLLRPFPSSTEAIQLCCCRESRGDNANYCRFDFPLAKLSQSSEGERTWSSRLAVRQWMNLSTSSSSLIQLSFLAILLLLLLFFLLLVLLLVMVLMVLVQSRQQDCGDWEFGRHAGNHSPSACMSEELLTLSVVSLDESSASLFAATLLVFLLGSIRFYWFVGQRVGEAG